MKKVKKKKAKKKITNCLDCPDRELINDRDPDDWFCDDDTAVVCTKTKNKNQDLTSKWMSNRSKFKSVTSSCRPYNLKKESTIPRWCPKKKKVKKMRKLVVLLFLLVIGLSGCGKPIKTPPWDEKQVKKMENDNIDTIPLFIMRF